MKPLWLFVCSLFFAGTSEAAGLRLQLTAGPFYTGTVKNFVVALQKESNSDGITVTPPLTLRMPLPAGVTFRAQTAGIGATAWLCTGTAVGATTIVCTYNGTMTPAQWDAPVLGLAVDVAPDAPVGAVALTATIESAQYPLPNPPNCAPSPSATGCATLATNVLASSFDIVAWYYPGQVVTWPGDQPFEAGTQRIVEVDFQSVGYDYTSGAVTLEVDLPPRFHFTQNSSNPAFTCTAQMQADHERVTCTTPALNSTGYVGLYVTAAPDIAVPGPVYFHAAIGNAVQPPPTNCAADPYQKGCGRLEWATRPPRVAALAFNGVQHSPAYFALGQRNGPLVVNVRNLGEGNASATTVVLRLPPGFHYANLIASLPAFACTPSGDAATGQILACTAAGLVASSTGFLSFAVDLDASTEAPGPVVLLGAIDQSSPASTSALTACASDPSPSHCLWHEIPTYAPCALQYGADGIYCDGFDETMPFAQVAADEER